jgi:6-phosphogluconolactonase (cycloisomerase 2 family)
VPDLGKDLIREFYYNRNNGKIEFEFNKLPSGLCTGRPDGPRYLHFHPKYNIAYVVNELSSTIAVFEVDRSLLQEIANAERMGEDMRQFMGRTTLKLIQSIKTIPSAFPTTMNTCGRICVHKSGRFVVVSNRGHQSIAVFKVSTHSSKRGKLDAVGYFHTRGETPRHFQFDASGQYLIVANQDTDHIAVFNFNLSSGDLKYTGNEYRVPSPNFVCCCPTQRGEEDDETEQASAGSLFSNISVVKANQRADSVISSGDDSDSNSCIMVVDQKPLAKQRLEDELTRARKEIDALKKELTALKVGATAAL